MIEDARLRLPATCSPAKVGLIWFVWIDAGCHSLSFLDFHGLKTRSAGPSSSQESLRHMGGMCAICALCAIWVECAP
jgi:hypothetical protein